MNRTTPNFTVDALAYLSLLGLTGTGLLIRWILPPGTGHRFSVWGLTRHEWGDMHFYFVIAFATLVLVHLVLHWSWICAAIGRLAHSQTGGKRRRLGTAIALSILTVAGPAVFLLAARSEVTPINASQVTRRGESPEPRRGQVHGRRSRATIDRKASPSIPQPEEQDDRPRHQRRRRLGGRSSGSERG